LIELFRREVLERRASKLHGDINLALPLGWQLMGYMFLGTLVAGAIFLSAATYTRVETVSGTIVPDKGVAAVVPTRAGILTELRVSEGMRVTRGMPIARVRVAETLASGGAQSDQLSAAIAVQRESLGSQSEALSRVYGQVRAR
jgi:membrane fusion protein